ncbi:hypothetical protein CPC08DRAFT_328722 [Agrocybe pediades]|nr:hypothetical protein CPC08DRAFT_328722 [Agrocybe pediades]
MDNPARKVRQHRKQAPLQVPQVPAYVQSFLPESSSLRSPIELREGETKTSRPKDSRSSGMEAPHAKMKRMEEVTKAPTFETVGDFLAVLIYNPSRATGETDPRSASHRGRQRFPALRASVRDSEHYEKAELLQ